MGSSTNGAVRRSRVGDGEGVDPTDFNNLSAWSRAYVNDMLIGAMMRTQQKGIGPQASASPTLYAIGHSGAPRTAAAALSYSCNAGPLFAAPVGATIDGLTPKVLCYYLTAGEISGTLAAGSAANPRFDAVYVRISEVDGPTQSRNFEDAIGVKTTQALVVDTRTKLEWLVVPGTPAALPQVPAAPDASWSPWGVYYVPKNWAATFQGAFSSGFGGSNVFDYRVPLGYTRHVKDPSGMYGLAGGTTISPSTGGASSTSTGEIVGVSFPVRGGRIMGFGFSLGTWSGGEHSIYVRESNAGGAAAQPPNHKTIYGGVNTGDPTIAAADMLGYTLSNGVWRGPSAGGFAAATADAAGHALLPLWANGFGSEAEDSLQGGQSALPNGSSLTWLACHFNSTNVATVLSSFCVDVAG